MQEFNNILDIRYVVAQRYTCSTKRSVINVHYEIVIVQSKGYYSVIRILLILENERNLLHLCQAEINEVVDLFVI